MAQNKANSRRHRVGRGRWDAERGVLYKQTQFWPVPCPRPAHHSNIPPFQHSNPTPLMQNKANFRESGCDRRAKRAKQSQTWAGWDTWRTACHGGANAGEQTQFPAGPGGTVPGGRGASGFVQTNPILPYADPEIGVAGRAHRAKQTQFPGTGRSQGAAVQTKPIHSVPAGTLDGRQGRTGSATGTIVRNKPNLVPGAGCGEAWGTRGVGFCTNKPNSTPMPIRRSAFAGAGGGEIDRLQCRRYNSLVCQATMWNGQLKGGLSR